MVHIISKPIVTQLEEVVQDLRNSWSFKIINGKIVSDNGFIPVNGGHVLKNNHIGLLVYDGVNWSFEPYYSGDDAKHWLLSTCYWDDTAVWADDQFWCDGVQSEFLYPLYPHFFYGHQIELVNDLKQLTEAKLGGRFKFPFIHLLMPFAEAGASEYTQSTLNFTFAMITEKKFSTSKRYKINVIPILNPILFQFLNQLEKYGIEIDDLNKIKTDQVVWGREEVQQVLSDPIDAVTLQIDCIFNQTKC